MIAELDLPVVNIKSVEKAEAKKQKKSQAARVINTWDTVAKDYTLDGKRQLVHLFTVCAGVPPPSVTEYVTSTSDGALPQYRTVVCVKDEEGKDVVGEGKGSGPNLNTDIAYERLFLQLSEKTALMRRLTSMMKSFQNTNMRAFPSLSLTEEQKKGMREIVDKLLPAAETSSPVLAHEADAGETRKTQQPQSVQRVREDTTVGRAAR
ncbi:hypothetical protein AGDE_12736 [Angomonas deanei]|nr:hypothetical protein AGDE_12736 [Angomonas deanei]|eukprot:EPY23610.1 hypothetical protein AGDE_12736 [Angomonas deanei]